MKIHKKSNNLPELKNKNLQISTEPSSTTAISTSMSNYHSISNRDLIKEYLARNQQPPAIFKPSFTPFSPPPQLEIAYKHPRLLMNSTDDENEEESIYRETINQLDLDDHSVDEIILAASEPTDRKSRSTAKNSTKLQNQLRQRKIDAFSSISTADKSSEDNECKLIGKVNPNLVRTWEQLNRKSIPPSNDYLKQLYRSRSLSNNSGDEKILYPDNNTTVDLTTAQSDGDFRINVMIHSESSEDFYDSIDDRFLSDLNGVPSICVENDDGAAAGEVMAEYDLLDKRKICWSIDSERLVYKKI